jgi:ABC transporter substrate binding protein
VLPLVRVVECSPASVDVDVPTFDPPELQEPLPECAQVTLKFWVALLMGHQHANAPHALALLGTRGKRPSCCATERRDERAPVRSTDRHQFSSPCRAIIAREADEVTSSSGSIREGGYDAARAGDPVELGLVASLNRPGGHLTGSTTLTLEVGPKRLELLHEMVPTATIFALLINPTSPNLAEAQSRDFQTAARTLGLQAHVVQASTDLDFDIVFARVTELQAGGLVVSSDSFLYSRNEQLAVLAASHAVPAIYGFRESAAAGGLMIYGGGLAEADRWVGVYTGRILKGEKPADMPVQQSTKFDLIINLKTAKALGLTVPPSLLARAHEVIE